MYTQTSIFMFIQMQPWHNQLIFCLVVVDSSHFVLPNVKGWEGAIKNCQALSITLMFRLVLYRAAGQIDCLSGCICYKSWPRGQKVTGHALFPIQPIPSYVHLMAAMAIIKVYFSQV